MLTNEGGGGRRSMSMSLDVDATPNLPAVGSFNLSDLRSPRASIGPAPPLDPLRRREEAVVTLTTGEPSTAAMQQWMPNYGAATPASAAAAAACLNDGSMAPPPPRVPTRIRDASFWLPSTDISARTDNIGGNGGGGAGGGGGGVSVLPAGVNWNSAQIRRAFGQPIIAKDHPWTLHHPTPIRSATTVQQNPANSLATRSTTTMEGAEMKSNGVVVGGGAGVPTAGVSITHAGGDTAFVNGSSIRRPSILRTPIRRPKAHASKASVTTAAAAAASSSSAATTAAVTATASTSAAVAATTAGAAMSTVTTEVVTDNTRRAHNGYLLLTQGSEVKEASQKVNAFWFCSGSPALSAEQVLGVTYHIHDQIPVAGELSGLTHGHTHTTFHLPVYCRPTEICGWGAYGLVARAKLVLRERDGGYETPVVLKRLTLADDRDAMYALREIQLMRHFHQHSNVVKLLDVIVPYNPLDLRHITLVLESMETSLDRVIRRRRQQRTHFTMLEIQLLMFELLTGLAHLHDGGVVHRDVAPKNLMINGTGCNTQLKIGDFGLAAPLFQRSDDTPTQSPSLSALASTSASTSASTATPVSTSASALAVAVAHSPASFSVSSNQHAGGGGSASHQVSPAQMSRSLSRSPSIVTPSPSTQTFGGGGFIDAAAAAATAAAAPRYTIPGYPDLLTDTPIDVVHDLTLHVVTRYYRAPEVALSGTYGTAIDTWAAGCVMSELFRGAPLLYTKEDQHHLHAVFQLMGAPSETEVEEYRGDRILLRRCLKSWSVPAWNESKFKATVFGSWKTPPPPIRRTASSSPSTSPLVRTRSSSDATDEHTAAYEVMRGLLTLNPRDRWSAKRALQHRWFNPVRVLRPTRSETPPLYACSRHLHWRTESETNRLGHELWTAILHYHREAEPLYREWVEWIENNKREPVSLSPALIPAGAASVAAAASDTTVPEPCGGRT